MEWLSENWIWVVVLAAFIGMHLFGHGAHGGRGQHNQTSNGAEDAESSRNKSIDHRHH